MNPEEQEKNYKKVLECENAVSIIEQFLNIQGTSNILESKKCKYKTFSLNIPATIASFRLFFMITINLLPPNDQLVIYYKLNVALLNYVLNEPPFNNICIDHKIDILLTNGFWIDCGFVWYSRRIEDYSF